MLDPRRSWGPVLECRRMGNPSPGVAPGELSHDGATRIFGVIRVLSDNRLLVKVFVTFKKLLLSLFDDENHLNMAGIGRMIKQIDIKIEHWKREKLYYLLIIEFFLAMFSAETVVDIESARKRLVIYIIYMFMFHKLFSYSCYSSEPCLQPRKFYVARYVDLVY